ncbi:MAG: PDDEXK nuclease domain-containing protein [Peptococcaceae bacterium]|nr:PDDEXK nuclease domain-containing protein [Peptococcaceae bacterium]
MGEIMNNDKLNDRFYNDIKTIIVNSKNAAIHTVHAQRVLMYWRLGERIFLEEQYGKDRADYGAYLIKNLAKVIEPEFGSGFTVRQIERARQFYRTYPIASALRTQLNWSQYRLLIAIKDDNKREYYELEAVNNSWTGRELERQINTSLYERLLISNDKESVLGVARKERMPEHPTEIIKDPMILEFLGLKREEFFADLVFHNRLLRCFVVMEIKTHKIAHQDLGQLQMYVNYFDRYEKLPDENPTVGILLCAAKNDTLVKITLPEDNTHILASQYQLYLPSEEALLEEIRDVWVLAESGVVYG